MGRKDTIMYYKVYLAKEIDPCYDRIYLLTDMEGYMTAEFLVSKSFNKAGAYLSITPNLNLPVVKISEDILMEKEFIVKQEIYVNELLQVGKWHFYMHISNLKKY